MADPVSITICGHPSREVMADLFDLAVRAGLGLVVQPRAVPAALPALPAVRTVKPRKVKRRANPTRPPIVPAAAVRKAVAIAAASTRQQDRVSPNRQAAAGRREAVIGALRRVGDVGLSFKALLDAVRPHLLQAGDVEQQVAALRNALTDLKRDGRVERVAGQWVNRE